MLEDETEKLIHLNSNLEQHLKLTSSTQLDLPDLVLDLWEFANGVHRSYGKRLMSVGLTGAYLRGKNVSRVQECLDFKSVFVYVRVKTVW